MRVLILCNDFPPLNSIGAQRPYSWYRFLRENGIYPIVITRNWKGFSSTPHDVLKNTGDTKIVKEETEFGTIIRVPILINQSEKMLLRNGPQYMPLFRKALTLLYRLFALPFFYFDNTRNIYWAAKEILQHEKIDGIIATGEPFILFKYAHLLHKKYGIPWIADYRDGWKLNYVKNQEKGIMLKFLRWWEYFFEKKYLPSAAGITTVDPILAKKLSVLHNKRAEVVYNGFDTFYNGQTDAADNDLPLILDHSGTLTPGQRVEVLLQAVKELLAEGLIIKNEIVIRFIGLGYFTDRVSRVTDFDPSVRDTILITPRVSREEVLSMNSVADYLITFSEATSKMINAKVYDYMAVKRPMLIIPDDESILSDLVKKLDAGQSPKDITELKEILLTAVKQKREGRIIPAPLINEKEALFYTRKKQTEVMAGIMKKYFSGI